MVKFKYHMAGEIKLTPIVVSHPLKSATLLNLLPLTSNYNNFFILL